MNKFDNKYVSIIDSGCDLIEGEMLKKYSQITPEFSRRADLLECLLVSFIEHATNIDALGDIEEKILANSKRYN